MDIYFRADKGGLMGYAAIRGAPVTTAAQHLSAAAARLALSMVRSLPLLDEAVLDRLKALLTLPTLWSLCIVIGAWFIGTAVGGLFAVAINGILILWGLSELWDQLGEILKDFGAWFSSAYDASNDSELAKASAHFAAALAAGGITAIELVVTHKAFKAAEVRIREKFKPPDWLGREYDGALRAAERKKSNTSAESVVRTAKAVASSSRGRGVRVAASNFPTGAAVVGGVLVAVGVSAAAAYALTGDDKK